MEKGETAVLALFFMCGRVEEVCVDGDEVEREDVGEEVEIEERIREAIVYERYGGAHSNGRPKSTPAPTCPPGHPRSCRPAGLGRCRAGSEVGVRVVCCVVPQAPEEPR